jgi:acetyl-CoA carboxylase biotin carboxyl carrier protein
MNLTQIQDLIKFVAKSGVSEVEIEQKDFKITIKTAGKKEVQVIAPAPVAPQQLPAARGTGASRPAAAAPPSAAIPPRHKYITIKAPMIGTFYRSRRPRQAGVRERGRRREAGQGHLHHRGHEALQRDRERGERQDREGAGGRRQARGVRPAVVPGGSRVSRSNRRGAEANGGMPDGTRAIELSKAPGS